MATVGTYHQVEVNGATGWVNDEAAYSVVWPLGDDTWAHAVSAESEQVALAFARSLEFHR